MFVYDDKYVYEETTKGYVPVELTVVNHDVIVKRSDFVVDKVDIKGRTDKLLHLSRTFHISASNPLKAYTKPAKKKAEKKDEE